MKEKVKKLLNREWVVIIIGILISAAITLCVVKIAIIEKEDYQFRRSYGRTDDFNSNLTDYVGTKTGSQVKSLIGRLMANATIYEDEIDKIPCVSYNTQEGENDSNKDISGQAYAVTHEEEIEEYVSNLNKLSNGINLKHTYYVNVTYSKIFGPRGKSADYLIRGITINYNKNDRKKENFEGIDLDDGLYGIKVKEGIIGPMELIEK